MAEHVQGCPGLGQAIKRGLVVELTTDLEQWAYVNCIVDLNTPGELVLDNFVYRILSSWRRRLEFNTIEKVLSQFRLTCLHEAVDAEGAYSIYAIFEDEYQANWLWDDWCRRESLGRTGDYLWVKHFEFLSVHMRRPGLENDGRVQVPPTIRHMTISTDAKHVCDAGHDQAEQLASQYEGTAIPPQVVYDTAILQQEAAIERVWQLHDDLWFFDPEKVWEPQPGDWVCDSCGAYNDCKFELACNSCDLGRVEVVIAKWEYEVETGKRFETPEYKDIDVLAASEEMAEMEQWERMEERAERAEQDASLAELEEALSHISIPGQWVV